MKRLHTHTAWVHTMALECWGTTDIPVISTESPSRTYLVQAWTSVSFNQTIFQLRNSKCLIPPHIFFSGLESFWNSIQTLLWHRKSRWCKFFQVGQQEEAGYMTGVIDYQLWITCSLPYQQWRTLKINFQQILKGSYNQNYQQLSPSEKISTLDTE